LESYSTGCFGLKHTLETAFGEKINLTHNITLYPVFPVANRVSR
jgi:hypothetical protein